MKVRWSVVFPIAVVSAVILPIWAQDATPRMDTDLAAADQLYQSGKFSEAIGKYQAALKADPKLVPAQAGLVRAYLRDEQIDAAFELAKTSLAAQPNSPQLLDMMGRAQYRLGLIPEAQTSYLAAQKLDPKLVDTYLGLAELYHAALFRRRAYDEIMAAHQLAPDDPDVQLAWLGMLPRSERVKALEAYLTKPEPDNPKEKAHLNSWLEYLKATADQPLHTCHLANQVDRTEIPMQIFMRDPKHIAGYGLQVKVNDKTQRLLLDTGAGGIVIERKAAEKAGVKRISAVQFGGIGSKGSRDAYLGLADDIHIGDLEFKDCVIRVSETPLNMDEDGVIGTDVFASYIVDVDIPADTLRLLPLPKRPDETDVKVSLATEEEAAADAARQPESATDQKSTVAEKASPPVKPRPPKDRYIPPEMANWARVYRIGHTLLIPTHVNDSKSMLFILDTGSFSNSMSTRAAKEVTKVRTEDRWRVKGFSGEVDKVYSADKAVLQFGNLRQPNQDIITFDLSGISRSLGTEVSGLVGYPTFRQVEMKIDYRDGLVDFTYDPSKLPANLRPR